MNTLAKTFKGLYYSLLLSSLFMVGCASLPENDPQVVIQEEEALMINSINEVDLKSVSKCKFIKTFHADHDIEGPGEESLEEAKKSVKYSIAQYDGSHVVWKNLSSTHGPEATGDAYQCDPNKFAALDMKLAEEAKEVEESTDLSKMKIEIDLDIE